MPFGFALSQLFRGRWKSLPKRLAIVATAGAALSYSIEITQLYIPSRDSAWDDVIANTLGTLAGAVFSVIAGGYVFRALSAMENVFGAILILKKDNNHRPDLFWLMAVSIPLQHKSRLDNWSSNSFLIVGYDLNEDSMWPGAISRIQLWDRSLSAEEALRHGAAGLTTSPLANLIPACLRLTTSRSFRLSPPMAAVFLVLSSGRWRRSWTSSTGDRVVTPRQS